MLYGRDADVEQPQRLRGCSGARGVLPHRQSIDVGEPRLLPVGEVYQRIVPEQVMRHQLRRRQ
jgi:hypothetical protein